jgi:Uma2 family endonuclease
VRLLPGTGSSERWVEIEGGPDVVIEIVSDSSSTKDTVRLPPAYHRAGVREFWLIDARGKEIVFRIHRQGDTRFEPVALLPGGFQVSEVLGCRCRLDRKRDEQGHWTYDLLLQD